MGFFLSDKKIDDAAIIKKPNAKAKKQITLGEKGCDNCPRRKNWGLISTPRMKTKGPEDADVLLLGGFPSSNADLSGTPFSGPTSQILLDLLSPRFRDRIAFQNAVRCASRENGEPEFQELHACSKYLDEDAGDIQYVIGVGQEPLRRYWPGASIARVHGVHIPIELGGKPVWYFPIISPAYVEEMGGMKTAAGTVLRADLQRFFRDCHTWGKPTINKLDPSAVIVPRSLEEAQSLVDSMLPQPLGIDIETADKNGSTLKPYNFDARILTGSISDGDLTIAFPIDHPEGKTDWGKWLLNKVARRQRWIAHNAGFEWMWLMFGTLLDERLHPFDDSQALGRCYFERESIAGLDDVSQAILGVDIKKLTGINAKMILEYPLSEVLPYNGLDAQASALIWRKLHNKVNLDNYERMLASIETVAEMELLGLPIDYVEAKKQKIEWDTKVAGIEERARKIYEVRQWEMANQKQFRLSANEDIGEALAVHGKLALPKKIGRGEKITYTTDDAALSEVTKNQKHPLVDCVTEYREASGTVSKYIDAFLTCPERYPDAKLHPGYNVLKVRTGRLSSDDPNIQNFPKRRHREVRRPIVPPKNHVMVAIDYGQLEARVIAMASQDRKLCESIISGYDVHSYWRDRILEKHPPYYERMAEMSNTDPADKKATMKGGRNIIKTDFVFASFFGASAGACAARTGLPKEKMQDVSDEFWNDFKGVKKWIDKQRMIYNDTASITTLTGRVRHGIEWGNEPINTPIQGTAADIVLDGMNAMRKLSKELKDPALMPRINIHDDLTFFLPDSNDLPVYLDTICETMTPLKYKFQIVPLMVEVSVGYNWADMEEVMTHTGEYHR